MNIIHKESRSKRTLSVSRCLRDAKAPGECLGESFCHKVMFLSRETGISGNFVGRIKGAKCPFDLQFLTWDFS